MDDQQNAVDAARSSAIVGDRRLPPKDRSIRRIIRFGVFEADVQTGELRKAGVRVKLQAQAFRVLTLLLECPGEIVTRAEIIRELWDRETFVDFDQSVGAVMRKLRRALGDSAAAPRYIETLRQRGYRFLLPTHIEEIPRRPLAVSPAQKSGAHSGVRNSYTARGLAAAMAVSVVITLWSGRPSKSKGSRDGASAQAAPPRSRNIDAYIAYEKGRYLWNVRTAAAVKNSIKYFQRAVNLDPNYASAYAGLADAYVILNFYTGRQGNAPIQRARLASGRALKLDRSIAEAHATQAYIKFYYEWDWTGAENAFRRAIALNPNYATAHQWYAEYLFYMGRFQAAVREIDRAHELDPQSVVINLELASPYLYSRDYDEAIKKIREALTLNPEFPLGIYMLGTCYEQLGRFDQAIAEYRKISRTALGLTGLGHAYARSGRRPDARRVLRELLSDSKRENLSAYHVARVYAALGDVSQTFAWLKKAQHARDERMVMLKVDPKLDEVRSSPLFNHLLQSLGLG